jgi:hypothetical protein
MSNLVAENEMFFNSFEPKTKNRFVVSIDGIPGWLIRKCARPKLSQAEKVLPHINVNRYIKGKSTWNNISISLYDAVVPSGAQAIMEWIRLHHESVTGRDGYADFYKKDVVISVLGPVGDKVEEWILKGAFIVEADFGDLDFVTDDPADITVTLRYDYAILSY